MMLYSNRSAMMGWHVGCKYDKATAFATYKYDLMRRLSTSSVYALLQAVYESPQQPPRWMWGSSGARPMFQCTLLDNIKHRLMSTYSTPTAYWHDGCNWKRVDRACPLSYTLDLSVIRAFLLHRVMNGLLSLEMNHCHLMMMMMCLNWSPFLAVVGATF